MSRTTGTVTTPESDEAPTGCSGQGSKDQGTADGAIVAAEHARVTAVDAQIAECRRRAAAKGMTLHVLTGELLFAWCGLTKALPDVDAAARWLDHVGAPR